MKVHLNGQSFVMHNSKSFTDAARGNTRKPFKCDSGPISQVTNLNRNLTQFRPSEINYQPDPTA